MKTFTRLAARLSFILFCLTPAFVAIAAPPGLGPGERETIRQKNERVTELVTLVDQSEVGDRNRRKIVRAFREINRLVTGLADATPPDQTIRSYLETMILCREKETEYFRFAAGQPDELGPKLKMRYIAIAGMPRADRDRGLTPDEQRLFRRLRQAYWERFDAYLACVAAFPNRGNRKKLRVSLSEHLRHTPELSDDAEAFTRHTIALVEICLAQIEEGEDTERVWDQVNSDLSLNVPFKKKVNYPQLRANSETMAPLTRWLIEHPHPSIHLAGLYQKAYFATGDDAVDASRQILDTLFPLASEGDSFELGGDDRFVNGALFTARRQLSKEQLNDWYNGLLDHVTETEDARPLLAYPSATMTLIDAVDPPARGTPVNLSLDREDQQVFNARRAGQRVANAVILLTCLRSYSAEGPLKTRSETLQSRLENLVRGATSTIDANTGGSNPWLDGRVVWTNLIPPESLGVWGWGAPWRLFKSDPAETLPVTVVFTDQNVGAASDPPRDVLRFVMARMSVDGQTFQKIAETSIPAGPFGTRRSQVASDGNRCALLLPGGAIRLLDEDGVVEIPPTGPGGEELLSTEITCLDGTLVAYGERHISRIDVAGHRLVPILGPATPPRIPGVAPGTPIELGHVHKLDLPNGLLWVELTAPKPIAPYRKTLGYFSVKPTGLIRPLPDNRWGGGIYHHLGKTYVTKGDDLLELDLDTWTYHAIAPADRSHPRFKNPGGNPIPVWTGRAFGEYLLTHNNRTFYLSTPDGKSYFYGFPPGGQIPDQIRLNDYTIVFIGGAPRVKSFETLKETQTQLHTIILQDAPKPE